MKDLVIGILMWMAYVISPLKAEPPSFTLIKDFSDTVVIPYDDSSGQSLGFIYNTFETQDIFPEMSYEEKTAAMEKKLKKALPYGKTKFVCALDNLEMFEMFSNQRTEYRAISFEELENEDLPGSGEIFPTSYMFDLNRNFIIDLVDIAMRSLLNQTNLWRIEVNVFNASEIGGISPHWDSFKDEPNYGSSDIHNMSFDLISKEGEFIRIRKTVAPGDPPSQLTRLYFHCSDYP